LINKAIGKIRTMTDQVRKMLLKKISLSSKEPFIQRKSLKASTDQHSNIGDERKLYGVKYLRDNIEQNTSKFDLKETKEVRKYPRKYLTKQAIFKSKNRLYKGTICNISRGGCFIETNESFNLAQRISLVVPIKKIDMKFELKAEIVRLSPIGIGVKFKSITE